MIGESSTAHAERRQITIAFVDLAGSTELSSHLDPEDFRNLILAYQEAVKSVIDQHDGYIARFFGDGILVYYGFPKAHENDAERAVRSGLAIIDAVATLDTEDFADFNGALRVRIGVMTGPAVVGDIVGEGAAQESTALGEIPNIAARLQSIAEPNQLVIGDTTQRIVDGLFVFEDLGKPELKGVGRAVQSFRVQRATDAISRFDRSLHQGLSQLVGRRGELEELDAAWADAETSCQAVAIVADAGIGKSRLIHEFSERLGREQAFFLSGHCIIDRESSPLHPFIELVRTAFQIRGNDGNIDEKLKRGLEILGLPADEHMPYLLNLLGRPPAGLQDLPAELQGVRTRQALQQLIRARCSRSRVLLVVEDLHWIDRLSESLLSWVLEEPELSGLLVIMSYRPGYAAPWADLPNLRLMDLVPLSPHSTGDLLRQRLGDAISEEVVSRITGKAEGNPLFAEEMANYLMRSEDKVTAVEGLPANLESLLLDRIDRLDSDPRTVLQAASVIGRRFTLDGLERVSGFNGKLVPSLDILQAQDLVFPESRETQFRFKHALVRDAVYHNLLRAERASLHLRLAQSLEQDYADRLDEVVDEIADHYAHTKRLDKTAEFLALAGEKSLGLYSLDAAATRFDRVLDIDRDNPGVVGDALLARVLLKLCRIYYFQYEFTKLIGLVDTYLPRIEALGDKKILGRFLFETGYAHVFGAKQDTGVLLLERAREVAESIGDEETIGYVSMGMMWHLMYWAEFGPNKLDKLESHGNRAIEIGRRLGDTWLVSKTMLAYANAYNMMGRMTECAQWTDALNRLAYETDDPRPLGASLFRRSYTEALNGDYEAAIDYAEEALRTSISPIDLAYGNLALALAQLMLGRLEESSKALIRLRDDMEDKGMVMTNLVTIEVPYAFMLLMQGKLGSAVQHLEQQMQRFKALGQTTAEAFGHLYLGQIFVILATSKERPTWSVIKRNLGFLLTTAPFAERHALRHLERSRAESQRLDLPAFEVYALIQLITLHRAKGRETEAAACLDKARAIATSIDAEYLLAVIDD
jgi:class 3 adenylate cyclase